MKSNVEPYSLLIADDDDAHRSTLQAILEPKGYRTILASDGREALEIVQVRIVHCLLLDMHMPELTGIEMLEIVRRTRTTLPAIMLTADDTSELRERARSLSVYSLLTKPVTREQVTGAVRNALETTYHTA
ncbi:Alkaline phosphatase synthesis transcriptional regulatory protein PhoP [Planctomycetes bacterium Pan216]|uniref:Alkaline phosphatase synthesis transcriptional regulatory protein PhoP n=1 Tax=Kolteria novifilia TaxID=2527975 RepID=A0A518B729_9BACT|nr:Alkaline phosphatase synthesis transcriptional regulatory protein PhoP [Planctomycetes bacterium Pan216]